MRRLNAKPDSPTPASGEAHLDRYMPLAFIVSAICAAFLIFFAR